MFGTSGIRGLYGKEITEELVFLVSNIFAQKSFAIGRDIRQSGLPLFHAAASGALCNGSEVIDLGIVPTPTVALASKKYAKSMMITASHNPPEYNGIKLIEKTKEISKKEEREIERSYSDKKRKIGPSGKLINDYQMIDEHCEMIKSLVDTKKIESKKPKIVIDCNGAGSTLTPYLLTDLGCKVISLHSSMYFERASEPNEKNLSALSEMVRTTNSDFGIAHDGDADRCIIVDEMGVVLPLDVQLAIMIENELENSNNKKIASTVESSLLCREIVQKNNGSIEITPVGSTNLAECIEKNNAYFGGEPCGEYVYSKGVLTPDGPLAAAKFLEIFANKGKFSILKKQYKENFVHRDKFVVKDKISSIEKIKNAVKIDGLVRSDDGLRVDEEDGWFLLRASGTEPLVRLTMEYKEKNKFEKRKKELTTIVLENI